MSRFECIVGGVVFTTTVEILTSVPDSFFSKALDGTWNSAKTSTLLIDRDGTHFQHVLNYLTFGFLPRDPAGRCNISKEVLELLAVEADFYGLPLLGKEIDQLLKFSAKPMRFFISSFFLNSGPSGGLTLEEFSTYEAALAKYEKCKNSELGDCMRKRIETEYDYENDDEGTDGFATHTQATEKEDDFEYDCVVRGDKTVYRWDEHGQNIVVEETNDPVTSKIVKQVYLDGNWKRPRGIELLCVPISDNEDQDSAMYSCFVRTHPDNRDYGY